MWVFFGKKFYFFSGIGHFGAKKNYFHELEQGCDKRGTDLPKLGKSEKNYLLH